MKFKSKMAVALSAGVLLSTLVQSEALALYDGQEACCNGPSVYLSSPSYSFDVWGKVLLLQPTSSNLCYAAEADPLPAPTPNWVIHDVRPKYHFGFELGLESIDCDGNTSLQANWTHLTASDSNSVSLPTSDMIGPFFEIGPDASPYNSARGHVTFHYDAVNLDYGVLVNFGDCINTNFFAGVGGARINQRLKSRFSNPDGSIVRNIDIPSKFLGAGPQIGFDFSSDFWNCLQLTGRASASLLVGNLKSHTDYEAFSPALAGLGITPPNDQSTKEHSRTAVVPAFEASLGLAYSYNICDKYTLNFEAGYEAKIYINAIQSTDISSEVITPPVTPDTVGVYARTFHRTVSNFAVAGPYISLDLAF